MRKLSIGLGKKNFVEEFDKGKTLDLGIVEGYFGGRGRESPRL